MYKIDSQPSFSLLSAFRFRFVFILTHLIVDRLPTKYYQLTAKHFCYCSLKTRRIFSNQIESIIFNRILNISVWNVFWFLRHGISSNSRYINLKFSFETTISLKNTHKFKLNSSLTTQWKNGIENDAKLENYTKLGKKILPIESFKNSLWNQIE